MFGAAKGSNRSQIPIYVSSGPLLTTICPLVIDHDINVSPKVLNPWDLHSFLVRQQFIPLEADDGVCRDNATLPLQVTYLLILSCPGSTIASRRLTN